MYSYLVNAWWTTRTSVGPKLCPPPPPPQWSLMPPEYDLGAAISHLIGVNEQTIACSPK